MTPPSWHIPPGGDVRVRKFDCTLLWPLRIEPAGALCRERENTNSSPSEWLDRYAGFVASRDNSSWRRQSDPYQSRFGTPGLYPDDRRVYQEFVYFHPFIQDLFYQRDSRRRVMAVLSRDDIHGAEVQLRSGEIFRFNVPRVQLFLFTTDVAIAAVQLSNPARQSSTLTDFEPVDLPLHTAMDLLNQVRHVYPPYWKNGVAPDAPKQFCWLTGVGTSATVVGKPGLFDQPLDYCTDVLENRRSPVAAHWRSLLAPIAPCGEPNSELPADQHDGLGFRQIGDDRIPVQSFLAVDRPRDISAGEFMRLTFLDGSGSDLPWSPNFMPGREADHWYDRYWHFQTRYLSAGYSFLLVVDSDSDVQMRDELRLHMQHHYFKMFLIAQLQKASLLVAWQRLSQILQDYAAQPNGTDSRSQFHTAHRWLAEDLASYTAIFEFSEVTNQVQGRELFQLMRRHLGSAELFAELVNQLEFARVVEQGNYTESVVASQLDLQQAANRLVGSQLALQETSNGLVSSQLALQETSNRLVESQVSLQKIANGQVEFQVKLQETANKQVEHQMSLQKSANLWIPLFLALSFLGMGIGVQKLDYWIDNPPFSFLRWRHVGLQTSAVLALMLLIAWAVFLLLYQLLKPRNPQERK